LKKQLKRQIKQDEFLTGVQHASKWVKEHDKPLRIGGLAVIVVAALAALGFYFQSTRAREAHEALGEALKIYEAPVAGEPGADPNAPPGSTYPNAQEKFKKAAAAFDGVGRRFSSSASGQRARYFAGLCRIQLGEYDAAEKILDEVASIKGGDGLTPALAKMALADLQKRRGSLDEAVEAYRKLTEDASLPLPRDYALMQLASTLEEAHRAAEARDVYRRLTEEFPGSVYASDARQRAEYLETAGQG
jgi:TolA-binding protein